jgi:hypothetical protein
MLRARDLIIDFINYAFDLGIAAFCILFFIVGDRFNEFGEFFRRLLPLSAFGLFFLLYLKIGRKKLVQMDEEKVINESITYITKADIFKDRAVIFLLPLTILSINAVNGQYDMVDFIQAMVALPLMFFWRKFLFRAKENSNDIIYLKNADKILDLMVVYLLPVIISLTGLLNFSPNYIIDFLQAFSVFAIMFVWHLILFIEKS